MPSSKPILGVNDLQSQFPEIAGEAYGWDPATVTKGSHQKRQWKCKNNHIWESSIKSRTIARSGCPFCAGHRLMRGVNDLESQYPEIASQVYEWDPKEVFASSGKKLRWKCNQDHIWIASVNSRTNMKSGCPICAGVQILEGFNDLKTKYPELASEAFGWDPATVTPGSNQKKEWQCKFGHKWISMVNSRTGGGVGCPVCSGNKVLVGFNDLLSKYPEVASETYDWDPSTVTSGSNQIKTWKCKSNHIYKATVSSRTARGNGCPFCSGKRLLPGFNDLQTKFPEIASESFCWDPTTVTSASNKKMNWKCSKGHVWRAYVGTRTAQSTGCPICAEYGFNPSKDAWFYLMQRPGEQQLGITNELDVRMKTHERNGWVLLEHTEPASGQKVLDTEKAFKQWLKKEIGLVKGTTENWSTTLMEVQSLAELKARSGIETDLF
jgi:hypothetical protein